VLGFPGRLDLSLGEPEQAGGLRGGVLLGQEADQGLPRHLRRHDLEWRLAGRHAVRWPLAGRLGRGRVVALHEDSLELVLSFLLAKGCPPLPASFHQPHDLGRVHPGPLLIPPYLQVGRAGAGEHEVQVVS
jgi:hypothetical protein